MANEYPQYDLIKQISSGVADVPGGLLSAYRAGSDYADKSAADAQKSKLQDIAIKQGQQKIQNDQIIQQTNQIKLDQLQKNIPLLDAKTKLDLQQTLEKTNLDATTAKIAALQAVDELQQLPVDEAVKHLSTANQLLTANTSDNDTYQKFLTSSAGQEIVKDHPEIQGSLNDPKVQKAIASVQAGVMAAAPILKSLAEKKIVADAALGRAQLSADTRLRVAEINKDARVATASIAKETKTMKVGKNDLDAATRLVYGRVSEDFPGSDTAAIAGMGAQVALIGNAIMAKGGYDQSSAYEAAYSRVKGAFEASGQDVTTMNKILSSLGIGGSSKTAPSITESMTVGVGDNQRTMTDNTAQAGPKVGDIVKGYKFKGGDPAAPANWEKQ